MVIMTTVEAYAVLGLETTASENQVKTAYKKLALKTHPDKNPNDPKARENFQRVSEAYKRITEPDTFNDEDDGEMDFDDLNEMFTAMFADMMGGMDMSILEMMMGGGGFGLYEDSDDDEDDEDMFFHDERNDMMSFHEFRERMGLHDTYLDESDEIDSDFEENSHADFMGGRSANYMNRGMGQNADMDDLIFSTMGLGGMEAMLGAAMLSGRPGGNDYETMLHMMGGDLHARSQPSKGSKNGNFSNNSDDEWETDSGDDIERYTRQQPQKKQAKSKNKKKKNKKKKSKTKANACAENEDKKMSDKSDPISSRAEAIFSSLEKENIDGDDITPDEMASIMASMLNGYKLDERPLPNGSSGESPLNGDASLGARLGGRTTNGLKVSKEGINANVEKSNIEVGDKVVILNNKLEGEVAYVGNVHYAKGLFVGVVVPSGAGKNNGTIKGKSYFKCRSGQGLMVRASDVKLI